MTKKKHAGGRPASPDSRHRTMGIRFTDDETGRIDVVAQAAGLAASVWARGILIRELRKAER